MEVFNRRALLAPMAGVTDRAMRSLCAAHGAALTYTEMVSVKGLKYNNVRTASLLASDIPCAVQLFGSDAGVMAEAAAVVCALMGDTLVLLDINMGCPAPKIVRNGDGCALMLDPGKAAGLIRAVKDAASRPVTVKFRAGFDAGRTNAVEFAKMAADAGADGLTVHPRTREQFYSGRADWGIIRAVKAAVDVPVVGSGDVVDGATALAMLNDTGCDAVMIARGALGNPFVFDEVNAALDGRAYTPPTVNERLDAGLKQLDMAVAFKGERRAVLEFRKHAVWYTKGMRNAARLRGELSSVCTRDDVARLYDRLRE